MSKRPAAVTFKGNPMTLVGPALQAGDQLPDFTTADTAASTVSLKDTPAKARLFSVVPSIDTPVCGIQTKKFSDAVAALGDSVATYTVSLDTPFAQKRFCESEKIANLSMLSDMHNGSFGKAYGVLTSGLPIPLLARSVFVVDKNNKIAYLEIVPEVTSHPDYDKAIAALTAPGLLAANSSGVWVSPARELQYLIACRSWARISE